MTNGRRYEETTAIARALNLVGERWALLIVDQLRAGPLRFSDLRRGLNGISPNVLTQRLAELERNRLVRRVVMAAPVSGWVYDLTGRGAALMPVLDALREWGEELQPSE